MKGLLLLESPPAPRPATARTKARAPKAAAQTPRKVWTGARKRLQVSSLQMSLPGLGQVI